MSDFEEDAVEGVDIDAVEAEDEAVEEEPEEGDENEI